MLETKKMGILIVGELFIRLSVELPLRLERSFAWNAPSLGTPLRLDYPHPFNWDYLRPFGWTASLRLDHASSVGPRLFGWTASLRLDGAPWVEPPLGLDRLFCRTTLSVGPPLQLDRSHLHLALRSDRPPLVGPPK